MNTPAESCLARSATLLDRGRPNPRELVRQDRNHGRKRFDCARRQGKHFQHHICLYLKRGDSGSAGLGGPLSGHQHGRTLHVVVHYIFTSLDYCASGEIGMAAAHPSSEKDWDRASVRHLSPVSRA